MAAKQKGGAIAPLAPPPPRSATGMDAVTNYYALVKVTQGETVISHVKDSLGKDRSGATSIKDARVDQHFSLSLLTRV